MSNHQAAFELLAESLEQQGIDIESVKTALKAQHIEFLDHYCVFMWVLRDDSKSVRSFTLGLYVHSTHLEEHRRSSAILNSGITS